MVVGNGMLAKRFESYADLDSIVIFASGVSNSKNTRSVDFQRELSLLSESLSTSKDKTFVYFSTCSIYDPGESGSLYVLHKLSCEKLVRDHAGKFVIFRVSNVVGRSSNPNTILNFFYYHLVKRINFDLWVNSWRNLIDLDDMYMIVDHILENKMFLNEIVNIANPVSYNVRTIVAEMERVLAVEGNYIPIEKGDEFMINNSQIQPLIAQLNINFDAEYLLRLIEKYYVEV